MAMITAPLLEALRTSLRFEFQQAYDSQRAASFYKRVATVVPSTSSSNTYGWLGDAPRLREWIGDRVVKDMKEKGYEIVNKLFEDTVGVQRTQIEDDNIGIYKPQAQSVGFATAEHPDIMISALMQNGAASLCYDGQNFFDTDHPVYPNHDGTGVAATVSNYVAGAGDPWFLLDTRRPLKPFIFQERTKPEFDALTDPKTSEDAFTKDLYKYGVRYRCNAGYGFWQQAYMSKAVLDDDSLDAAIAAMMKVKGDGGRPLGIMPNMLVVSPDNRAAANKAVKAINRANGESNTNYEAVEVLIVPWLAA